MRPRSKFSNHITQYTIDGCKPLVSKDPYRQSKKGGKDQESMQSSTTPDPAYRMGK